MNHLRDSRGGMLRDRHSRAASSTGFASKAMATGFGSTKCSTRRLRCKIPLRRVWQVSFHRSGRKEAVALAACVLDVFVSPPESVACFRSGVGIRFQEIDGAVEGHGFAARGTSARIGNGLGLHASHIPFQASEVDLQGAADAEGRDALVQVLKRRTDILQVFTLRQDSLNLQLMRQLCFQVAIGGELIVRRFGAAIDQFQRIVFFWIVPARRFVGRGALCVLRRARESTEEKTQHDACKKDRVTSHWCLSEGWEGCTIHTLDSAGVSRGGWELGKSRSGRVQAQGVPFWVRGAVLVLVRRAAVRLYRRYGMRSRSEGRLARGVCVRCRRFAGLRDRQVEDETERQIFNAGLCDCGCDARDDQSAERGTSGMSALGRLRLSL